MSKIYAATDVDDVEAKYVQPGSFVTNWFTLRDRSLLPKYVDFQQTQVHFISETILLIYTTLTFYRSICMYLSFPSSLTLFTAVVSVLMILSCWISYTLRTLFKRRVLRRRLYLQISKALENVWLICFNLWFCITLILSAYNTCDSADQIGCRNTPHSLPPDRMIVGMMLPTLTYLVIRSARWEVVVFTYLMNLTVILICIYYYQLYKSLVAFWTYFPLSTLFLYEYQRQILSLFEASIIQSNILAENEKLADEAHSIEMRHMIGNVAHDLKTPLTAFMCGLDLIKASAEEIKVSLNHEALDRLLLAGRIASILENAVNVINTNSFMLMTINRCIDYTKATNNLKLTPRLESINLQETINLPMHCMKDLQSDKVNITCIPLSRHIASYIITDKQWLQENILCLLSNAVKYSSKGTVVLSVALVRPFRQVSPSLSEEALVMEMAAPSPSPTHMAVGGGGGGGGGFGEEKSCDSISEGITGKVLRIEVEDTGIGLTEEVMANLFKPFKQAQRLAGGTGLGLFSLARRMEALGGMYGVMKRRDGQQGSIFWFEIPYRPDTDISRNIVKSLTSSLDPYDITPPAQRSIKRPDPQRLPPGGASSQKTTSPSLSSSSPQHSRKEQRQQQQQVVFTHSPTADVSQCSPGVSTKKSTVSTPRSHRITVVSPRNSQVGPTTTAPASSPTAPASAGITPPQSVPSSNKEGVLNILVVDDSPSILKMSSKMLEKQGHRMTTAENGAEALEVLIDNKTQPPECAFHVVLMDLQMPVMDGLEATKRLRKHEAELGCRGGHTLIIGVSANSDEETVKEAFMAGVDAFIPKPFNFQLFNEVYQSIVNKQHQQTLMMQMMQQEPK